MAASEWTTRVAVRLICVSVRNGVKDGKCVDPRVREDDGMFEANFLVVIPAEAGIQAEQPGNDDSCVNE